MLRFLTSWLTAFTDSGAAPEPQTPLKNIPLAALYVLDYDGQARPGPSAIPTTAGPGSPSAPEVVKSDTEKQIEAQPEGGDVTVHSWSSVPNNPFRRRWESFNCAFVAEYHKCADLEAAIVAACDNERLLTLIPQCVVIAHGLGGLLVAGVCAKLGIKPVGFVSIDTPWKGLRGLPHEEHHRYLKDLQPFANGMFHKRKTMHRLRSLVLRRSWNTILILHRRGDPLYGDVTARKGMLCIRIGSQSPQGRVSVHYALPSRSYKISMVPSRQDAVGGTWYKLQLRHRSLEISTGKWYVPPPPAPAPAPAAAAVGTEAAAAPTPVSVAAVTA